MNQIYYLAVQVLLSLAKHSLFYLNVYYYRNLDKLSVNVGKQLMLEANI